MAEKPVPDDILKDDDVRTVQPSPEIPDTLKALKQHAERGETKAVAPPIASFPEKVQPVLRSAYERALGLESDADKAAEILGEIAVVQKEAEAKSDIQVKILTRDASEDAKRAAAEQLASLQRDFVTLAKAYTQLRKGHDAPEFRHAFSDRINISPTDTTLYGDVPMTTRARRLLKEVRRPYKEGKARYQQNLVGEYNVALTLFKRSLIPDAGYASIKSKYPHNLEEDTALDKSPQGYRMVLEQHFAGVEPQLAALATQKEYLALVEEWLRDNAQLIQQTRSFEIPDFDILAALKSKLGSTKQQFESDIARTTQQLQEYPKRIQGIFSVGPRTQVIEARGQIVQLSEPMPKGPRDGAKDYPAASVSQEFTSLLERIQSKFPHYEIEEKLAQIHKQNEISKEFPNSQQTLWHSAIYDTGIMILKTGAIASRKYQLDNFGRAVFTSEGIIVGNDHIITARGEKRSKENRAKWAKELEQEAHQVCFGDNSPHYGAMNGINFIFDKPAMLAGSQFMEEDGWHLFDSQYQHEDANAPGYSVDLTKALMVVAVVERQKEQFEKLVKDELALSQLWQETLSDPEAWLADTVVYIPEQLVDPQTRAKSDPIAYNEARQAFTESVNRKLLEKRRAKIPAGAFMPSGEVGEDRGRSLNPLFIYKPIDVAA